MISKDAHVPQAGGLPGSLLLQKRKGHILENSEASASEDHLPLVPRGRGEAVGGTKAHGERRCQSSPCGRGSHKHKSSGEVIPLGPGVGSWLGAGKVLGTRQAWGTELD